jgi:membrane-associated phospholipid phosphatase
MILMKCLTVGGFLVFLCGAGGNGACAMNERQNDSAAVAAPADTASVHHPAVSPAALDDSSGAVEGPHFFSKLGRDLAAQAVSPFTMNRREAAYVGAGLGITLGLVALDARVDRSIKPLDARYPLVSHVSSVLTNFGGPYGIMTAIAYAGYSVVWSDEEAQQTSMLLAQALITSGVWTRLGKLLAGRERPSAAYEFSHLPGGRWHGLGGSLRKHSNETLAKYDAFPSGHTATAFAIATVFAKRYSESAYVPALSYSLATLVGITRMIEHTHWASDVFAGACIGYLCADQVVAQYDEYDASAVRNSPHRKSNVRVSLGMLNQSPAINLALGF